MSFDDVARRMKGRSSPAPLPMVVTGDSQFGLAMIAAQQRNRTQRNVTLMLLFLALAAAAALVALS